MNRVTCQRDGIPLSAVDLAMVADGATSKTALSETTTLAHCADQLGFARFWVAEHHNMSTVASTSPAVLIAHLASVTKRIRVGSGGVMLPNHTPLVIAEQFAMLEALHPNRIDLGIGRAPGTSPSTALALRRSADAMSTEDFPRQLLEVMGLLGDIRTPEGPWQQMKATPVATGSPQIALLGSSGFSAQLSGMLGLPFAFANHFDLGGTIQACELYREQFRPSPVLDHPHTIVSATVVVAASAEIAAWRAGPGQLRRYAMRTGRFLPLYSPKDASKHPEFKQAIAMPTNALLGTSEHVAEELAALATTTQANELMIHTPCHNVKDRVESLERVAEAWKSTP